MNGISVKNMSGFMPTGLPGGFFIYEAEGEEKLLFAEENVIKLFGCNNIIFCVYVYIHSTSMWAAPSREWCIRKTWIRLRIKSRPRQHSEI